MIWFQEGTEEANIPTLQRKPVGIELQSVTVSSTDFVLSSENALA